jgi:hypothetical protein
MMTLKSNQTALVQQSTAALLSFYISNSQSRGLTSGHRQGTGFHKYANVSVFAAARPVRAAIMWPSARALGNDPFAREAPRGATEEFPGVYAAPYGAQLSGLRSYPRLSPWARLCRP